MQKFIFDSVGHILHLNPFPERVVRKVQPIRPNLRWYKICLYKIKNWELLKVKSGVTLPTLPGLAALNRNMLLISQSLRGAEGDVAIFREIQNF